jgi:hypothetical protein
MDDLDRLAMAMPGTTRDRADDGRPSYRVGDKLYCCHRSKRPDAVDPLTGERLDDVLMFRVADLETKDALLAEPATSLFTTAHFNGYPAVLVRIKDLRRMKRDELFELVADSWLTRAPKRVAATWLRERGL